MCWFAPSYMSHALNVKGPLWERSFLFSGKAKVGRDTMKAIISVAAALALALSCVPAIAGDTFRALSSMPAGEQKLLTPLSDEQLAAVEGENILELIHLLQVSTPENAATLISQILSYIQDQLHINLTPTTQTNVTEVIQLHSGVTSNSQNSVVQVTQQGGKTVSFTRQGM
jgi:hypothetical protein